MRVPLSVGVLFGLLSACSAEQPQRLDLSIEPAAGPVTADAVDDQALRAWPKPASCLALLDEINAMEEMSSIRLDSATSPLGLASLYPLQIKVLGDLPIPHVTVAALHDFECAVVIGSPVTLPAAADRLVAQRTLQSTYPTDTRRKRNPAHLQLERALAAARRDNVDNGDVLRTGDPLLDLIGTVAGGIIGGIEATFSNREIRALEAQLGATPRYIEEALIATYEFEVSEFEAERRVAVPMRLHDRAAGIFWRTSVTLAERRRFALAENRHPQDQHAPQASDLTLATPAELAAWRLASPPLTIRAILTHLGGLVGIEGQQGSLTATIEDLSSHVAAVGAVGARDIQSTHPYGAASPSYSAWPSEPPVAADTILAALEPAGGISTQVRAWDDTSKTGSAPLLALELLQVGIDRMAGFYVTADHVVAPAEALGHSSLVAVRYPDGMRAHGLVELVDDDLGLALIFLPRPGKPLPRHTGPSPAPTTSGPAGVPWHLDGLVTGLFVTDPQSSGRQWVDAASLEKFIARLDML